MKAKSPWLSRIGYLVFLLIVQEIALRICFPIPELSNFDRMPYWVEKKGIPFMRGEDREWQSMPDTNAVFLHDLNLYGFRDTEWKVEREPGKKRVLFIGDSFMEGIMAPQEQTIPKGFLGAADADQFEVLNAGMLGANVEGYLRLIRDAVPIFQPDYLVFCFYENDGIPYPPTLPGKVLEPHYFSPFSPRLVEFFRQRSQNNPLQFRWAAPRPFLASVPNPGNPWSKNEYELSQQVRPDLARAMKEGKFNFFRTNVIAKSVENLRQPLQMGEAMAWLSEFCQETGVKPIVFYLPARHQVTNHYYAFDKACCQLRCPNSLDLTGPEFNRHQVELAVQCREVRLPFFDLSPEIQAKEKAGKHLYWEYDDHMRGSAYLWVGGLMHRELEKEYGD